MKIKLKKGKQRELIFLAKGDLTWEELSKIVQIPAPYLSRDFKYEKVLISEELYKKLCKISQSNYNLFIVEKLDNN